MSFYDDASWLLIPEGIEEDIVFAQKPTNGTGDLTFTRASDATRTNSAGVIERTPWNLLTFSEMFSDASWSKITSGTGVVPVVTANVALAPNGTMTADRIVFNAGASGASLISQDVAGGIGYTFSIYVKSNTSSSQNIQLRINSSLGTTITVTTEWQRFTVTSIAWASAIRGVGLDLRSAVGTTADLLVWGAQFVEGTDAKPYFATTNRQDVPRLDYRNADGSLNSCPRLLLEPQRTNSIRNSTMVGAVAGSPGTAPTNWATATSGLTQTIVGIGVESGLQYIDFRFNGTSTGTTVTIQQEGVLTVAASVSQVWTSSLYSKVISAPTPPTSYQIRLREGTSGGSFVADGLQTFVPTSSLQRFAFTRTNTGATTAFIQPSIVININNGATYDFTIRIAAPQMELGAYATTFIPTTTAAVTRLADNFTRSNIFTNSFITAAGGTWFLELDNNTAYTSDTNTGGIFLDTGNFGYVNGFLVRKFTNGRVIISKYISSSGTNLHTTTTDRFKMAIKWNGTTADVFVNGVKVTTATAFTTTAMQFLSNNGNFFMAFLNQSALFPTPLTDAQCIQLTT